MRSLILLLALVAPLAGQAPKTGADVLELMHRKYDGKWYQTLLFHQTTTIYRGDSSTQQTWHESLRYTPGTGSHLRIDNGDPSKGNGSVSTWDSTWVMRNGQLARTSGSGNPFLGLIENVYLQPAATTVHQLEPLEFDMTQVTSGMWEGRPAWVVGVATVSDSMHPQFWIDKERLVVVRMRVLLAPNQPPFDIQLSKYVATGGGWLATKVSMYQNAKPLQVEEYYDWKTRTDLDPRLFDPATWTTATHWIKP